MKKNYILLITALFCLNNFLFSQAPDEKYYTVTPAQTENEAKKIIEDRFLKQFEMQGTVSNLKIIGVPEAIGYYVHGETLGLKSTVGIVLSTGRAKSTEGPNDHSGKSESNGVGGDVDAEILAQNKTYDASGFEFDFHYNSGEKNFVMSYVFGSEEYHEYSPKNDDDKVNPYSDVMGVFATGKNYKGEFSNHSQNFALVPITNQSVNLNNVHCGYESEHRILPPGKKAGGENKGQNCNFLVHNDHVSRKYIQMDAYIVPFLASIPLYSDEKMVHIKVVIADSRDGAYNSAIFLEGPKLSEGIDDIDQEDEIKIYPNPTSGEVTITAEEDMEHPVIYVYDLRGSLVVCENLSDAKENTINLSFLPSGIYQAVISDSGVKLYSKKIQVK
ncbi:MAG: choice-of-anchor L domain-containing protein [Bacteroidales bacterium]